MEIIQLPDAENNESRHQPMGHNPYTPPIFPKEGCWSILGKVLLIGIVSSLVHLLIKSC